MYSVKSVIKDGVIITHNFDSLIEAKLFMIQVADKVSNIYLTI